MPLCAQGVTDEATAKGRAILEREKTVFNGVAHIGETHAAFSTRRKVVVKKIGLELNRFFGRGNKAAGGSEAAAVKEEQRTSLLAEEREERAGPPLSRAEELKARLASKVAAVKTGGEAKESGGMFSGAGASSSGAGPSRPAPAPAQAPSGGAASGGTSGDSLDALFANMGRR